jgi:hypothetical protein
VEQGVLVKVTVPELRFERKIRVIYRRGSALSHAAQAFLTVAEDYSHEHQGAYTYVAEH